MPKIAEISPAKKIYELAQEVEDLKAEIKKAEQAKVNKTREAIKKIQKLEKEKKRALESAKERAQINKIMQDFAKAEKQIQKQASKDIASSNAVIERKKSKIKEKTDQINKLRQLAA